MNWVVVIGIAWLAVALPVAYLIGRALLRADRRDEVEDAALATGSVGTAPPAREASPERRPETSPRAPAAHRDGDEAGSPGRAGHSEADAGGGHGRFHAGPSGTDPAGGCPHRSSTSAGEPAGAANSGLPTS
jgi:hypothetical protein